MHFALNTTSSPGRFSLGKAPWGRGCLKQSYNRRVLATQSQPNFLHSFPWETFVPLYITITRYWTGFAFSFSLLKSRESRSKCSVTPTHKTPPRGIHWCFTFGWHSRWDYIRSEGSSENEKKVNDCSNVWRFLLTEIGRNWGFQNSEIKEFG